MKKTFFIVFLLPASILYMTTGCSKSGSSNNGNNNNEDANMKLITAGPWIYDTAGVGADNSGTIVYALPPGTIKDCQKEDTLYFKSDGTGTEVQGPLKCDTSNTKPVTFTWAFNSQENMLTSSDTLFASFGGSITITSLTSTQLHLLTQVTVSGNLTVPVNLYLKHP
ncbi:MAG TPA: hypothetical protein VMI35_00100 [Puia sp.]|nr:hypothetical protein [Puia sp.]